MVRLVGLLFLLSPVIHADELGDKIDFFKVIYVYRFSERLPEDTQPTFDICFKGRVFLGDRAVDAIKDKKIHNKPIRVRQIRRNTAGCRTIFFNVVTTYDLTNVIPSLSPGTLTISDLNGFVNVGGMVELIEFPASVKYKLNYPIIIKNKLSLSQGILNAAEEVIK